MTAIIITSNLQKGSSPKNRTMLLDYFHDWFHSAEVQLDPEKIMILAGNLQNIKTHQHSDLFRLIAHSMKKAMIPNMTVLWVRGNRDYWDAKKQNFMLRMKEQESIQMIEKDSIYKNFIHISKRSYITANGILITGFDDWHDEISSLNPDLDFLPPKIKNLSAHDHLLFRRNTAILDCLSTLKKSMNDKSIKKRIVVSYFPYNKYLIGKDQECNYNDAITEIEEICDAWIWGNGEYFHEEINGTTYLNPGSTTQKPHAFILKL